MSSEDAKPPVQSVDPSVLPTWQRVFMGLVGVGGVLSGAFATFHTENQAGSLGLLGAGAICLVLSITGQSLRRIKVGEAEAEFYERLGRKTVDRAQSDGRDGDVAQSESIELVESVARTSGQVPAEVRQLTEEHSAAVEFERNFRSALAASATKVVPDRGVDYIVGNTGVELRYRSAGRAPGVNSISPGGSYYHVVLAAAAAGVNRLVIVTNSQVSHDFSEDSLIPVGDREIGVRIVKWSPGDPLPDLTAGQDA